jgi:hypothetical protein
MRNFVIRWFLALMAGKRVAYWIDDKAEKQMLDLANRSVAGAGAAIVLCKSVEKMGATHGRYELADWVITVKQKVAKP